MSNSIRIAKNTVFLYIKMGITVFISLLTTRMILSSLGSSDYGIFNVVGGTIGMLSFLNASMASATQRFMSYTEGEGNKEKQKYIFNISLILHFIISLAVGILLLLAWLTFFSSILNIPSERLFAAKIVYLSLIISTMFTIMSVPYDAVLNAHENMLYYSIVGVAESILKFIVALLCVYTSYDKLIFYGIFMAIIPIITLSLMRIYCHKKYVECIISPKKYWNNNIMKDMTSFACWNFFSSFSSIITGYGHNIILNHFFGTKINAANGVCGQLNGQLQAFSNNLIKAINPVIVKQEGAKQRENMYKMVFMSSKIASFLYVLLALPFIFEIDFILKFWLKNPPEYTGIFCQIAIVTVILAQISGPLSTAINAVGRIKFISLINGLINLLSLLFIFLVCYINQPPYSFLIVSLISKAIIFSVIIYLNYKYSSIRLKVFIKEVILRIFVPIIFTSIILYIITKEINEGLIRFILVVISSFITYLSLFYLYTLNIEEKNKIKDLIINKIKPLFIRYHG